MERRFTKAFWVAGVILIAAFAADTATTAAGGRESISRDLNPLVRGLSVRQYVGFSFFRAAIAASILAFFWPGRLAKREWLRGRGTWLAVILPFPFEPTRSYLPAALVTIVGPIKLAAAGSNLAVLRGGPPFPAAAALLVGICVGVILSNSLLLWHSRVV